MNAVMLSYIGAMNEAEEEAARQKIEEDLAFKAPGYLKPFMACCGGPVETLDKFDWVLPPDQELYIMDSIKMYRNPSSFTKEKIEAEAKAKAEAEAKAKRKAEAKAKAEAEAKQNRMLKPILKPPPINNGRPTETEEKAEVEAEAGPSGRPTDDAAAGFCIIVDRSSGARIGLDVDIADGTSLTVEGIAEGAVDDWNRSNPDKAVRVGDRIMAVNGISWNATSMLAECRKPAKLEMCLQRGW